MIVNAVARSSINHVTSPLYRDTRLSFSYQLSFCLRIATRTSMYVCGNSHLPKMFVTAYGVVTFMNFAPCCIRLLWIFNTLSMWWRSQLMWFDIAFDLSYKHSVCVVSMCAPS
jgi:hypothetical protein